MCVYWVYPLQVLPSIYLNFPGFILLSHFSISTVVFADQTLHSALPFCLYCFLAIIRHFLLLPLPSNLLPLAARFHCFSLPSSNIPFLIEPCIPLPINFFCPPSKSGIAFLLSRLPFLVRSPPCFRHALTCKTTNAH